MSNIAVKWNILDTFIYKIESIVQKRFRTFKENQNGLPDAETMINAATNYLQEENRKLKKLSYPKPIIKSDDSYFCPNPECHIEISTILVKQYRIKYCMECGQRLFLKEGVYDEKLEEWV